MANLNLSQFGEKLFVADADHTFIWDSAASISKKVSRNSWLNSGTLTSDAPVTISQTWNQIGTTFTAFKVNAVSTASASGSLLLDLQVGGVSQFKVDKSGVATLSADGVPQLRMISVTGSGSVFNGLTLESSLSTLAGFLVNRSTGEVKIGGLSNAGYFPTFYSNNAERMRITTAGNVGIGTTAPGSALHISGQMGGNVTTYDSASSLKLTNTSGGVISWLLSAGVIGIANNYFAIRQESTAMPALTIANSTNNIGIGTTAPSTLLHIHKDQSTDTELRVQNSSDLLSATATINLIGSQGSTLVLQANSTTVAAPDTTRASIKSTANVFGLNLKAESTIGTLQFYTGGGAAANERLRITAAGNVGIGTTSPTSKLHVAETWNAAGTTFAAAKIVVTDTASAAASNLLELWSGSTPALKSYVTKSGSFVGGVVGANQPSALSFPNSGSYSVGIYNPASYKIQFSMSSADPGGVAAGAYSGLQYEMTAGVLSWGTTAQDIVLLRDGEADHLAMRRSTNGQKFSVYGTYPGAAWERFTITAPTSGNVLLGTYKGTGGIARGLEFQTDGVTRMSITAAGTQIVITSGTQIQRNDGGGAIYDFNYHGVQFANIDGLGMSWSTIAGPASSKHVGIFGYASEQGVVQINSTVKDTFRDLRVRSVIQQPPATITPSTNGDLVVEATSNTTLTFKLKGTDGTVRSGTITLA